MKSTSFTRLGGKTKSGRPVVNKYFIGSSQGSAQSSFLKNLLLIILAIGLALWFYWLHTSGLIVWFNRTLISEKTIIAIDLNIVQSNVSHYLFSILNSLLIGVYLSATFPLSGKRSRYVSIILIVFIIVFAVLSLGYVGIFLYLNFHFLQEKTFISNQVEGIKFFVSNIAWFLLLYAISLLIESEVD